MGCGGTTLSRPGRCPRRPMEPCLSSARTEFTNFRTTAEWSDGLTLAKVSPRRGWPGLGGLTAGLVLAAAAVVRKVRIELDLPDMDDWLPILALLIPVTNVVLLLRRRLP